MSAGQLCRTYQVLVHFTKSTQLCAHDLFSVGVLFRIRDPCVSNFSRLPTLFLNKLALETTIELMVHRYKHLEKNK